jgi:hypothetical protein
VAALQPRQHPLLLPGTVALLHYNAITLQLFRQLAEPVLIAAGHDQIRPGQQTDACRQRQTQQRQGRDPLHPEAVLFNPHGTPPSPQGR